MRTLRHFRYALLLLGLTVFLTNCKKEDDEPEPKTKKELLTQRYWKYVSRLSDGVENIQACEKDNIYLFTPEGKLYIHAGSDNCGGMDVSWQTNWNFLENETIITYGMNALEVTMLTEDTLKLTFVDFDVMNVYAH